MAKRAKAGSGNGQGGEGATVTLLEAIREQLVGVRGEISAMRHEMSDGFRLLSDRIDNVLVGPLGEAVRRHEREIKELKAEVRRRRSG